MKKLIVPQYLALSILEKKGSARKGNITGRAGFILQTTTIQRLTACPSQKDSKSIIHPENTAGQLPARALEEKRLHDMREGTTIEVFSPSRPNELIGEMGNRQRLGKTKVKQKIKGHENRRIMEREKGEEKDQ